MVACGATDGNRANNVAFAARVRPPREILSRFLEHSTRKTYGSDRALYLHYGQTHLAWSMVHRFGFFTGSEADHGELCFLYLAVFLALAFTGAGRYSVDALIARKSYD